MSERAFKTLEPKRELRPADKVLKGPGSSKPASCIEHFTTHTPYKDKNLMLKIYVVRGITYSAVQ